MNNKIRILLGYTAILLVLLLGGMVIYTGEKIQQAIANQEEILAEIHRNEQGLRCYAESMNTFAVASNDLLIEEIEAEPQTPQRDEALAELRVVGAALERARESCFSPGN